MAVLAKNPEFTSDQELRQSIHKTLNKENWSRSPSRAVWPLVAYILIAINLKLSQLYLNDQINGFLLFVSIIITGNFGTSFFFLLHEIMHGAIFKNKKLKWFFAYLCACGCLVTPYLWRQWHNWHHKYTAGPLDTDRMRNPVYDNFADKIQRLHNKFKRFSIYDPISWAVGVFALPSHHILMALEVVSGDAKFSANKPRVILETVAVYLVAILPLLMMDFAVVLLGIYSPMVISSCICSLYILTNHNNNPLTTKNVTLLNSTSVNLDPFTLSSHFNFGRHIEHHLFPAVSHDKLKPVTVYLRENHSSEFNELNFFKCIGYIFGRPKDFNQKVETIN